MRRTYTVHIDGTIEADNYTDAVRIAERRCIAYVDDQTPHLTVGNLRVHTDEGKRS